MPPFEGEYLRKDGSRVPMLAMATLLDQERRLALVVTLDISDRKAAERRKQEFLRMVSHELRTPLTAILGLIELALRDIKRRPTSLAPEAEGLLGQIEQKLTLACGQVDIETRLVGDLLEVSQLEMHQFYAVIAPGESRHYCTGDDRQSPGSAHAGHRAGLTASGGGAGDRRCRPHRAGAHQLPDQCLQVRAS